MTDIQAINTHDNLALLTDDTTVPITNYLDEEGEECAANEAVAFVCGAGDLWLGGLIDDFESVVVH